GETFETRLIFLNQNTPLVVYWVFLWGCSNWLTPQMPRPNIQQRRHTLTTKTAIILTLTLSTKQ
ncbi:MAG: hypothetical protein IIT88_01195, partial [Acetobacter sp.]|nr:hypothetical protein [Acetobacter sp.]